MEEKENSIASHKEELKLVKKNQSLIFFTFFILFSALPFSFGKIKGNVSFSKHSLGEEKKSSIASHEEELKLVKKYQSQWHSSRLSFIRRNEMFMARVFRNHEEKAGLNVFLSLENSMKGPSQIKIK